MNLSTPLILCEDNDDIRSMLKSMLIKHGYFHLLEAQNSEEALELMSENHFILIKQNLINSEMKRALSSCKNFLILTSGPEAEMINLSVFFGVKHIMSFPFTSKSLIEKIKTFLP